MMGIGRGNHAYNVLISGKFIPVICRNLSRYMMAVAWKCPTG